MSHRAGRLDALLAEDVGDRMLQLDVDDDNGALVVAPRLVVHDDAEQRQEAQLEAVGQQPVVEEPLLHLVHVAVRHSADQGGSLRALGEHRGALQLAEGLDFPGLGMLDLELFPDEIGEVVGLGQFAGLDALALQESSPAARSRR